MGKIDVKTYKLYCKYNGQAEWEDDFRVAKPKDVYKNIGVDFNIISVIYNNLYMIKSGLYSKQLIEGMQKEIDELRPKLTNEVYRYIEKNESILPESEKTFFQRLLNKIEKKF